MPTASDIVGRIRSEGVDQYVRDMGKAEQATDKAAKNMQEAGKHAGGLSSSFGDAAKQAGVFAAGLGAFDIGKQAIGGLFSAMESGVQTTGKLQAQLGLTKDEAQALGDVGTQVFRNNFAGSLNEATTAAGKVQQILGTMDSSALQTATENAFRLNDAFGVEVPESLSAVKTLMDNFGLSSEQAFDLVTAGFQKGLDRSGDFLDTINEYGTQFKNNGFTAEQFFNVLDSGLQGGVLGTDKAADAVKEFGIRFTEMAGPVKKALGDIGLNADAIAAQIASGQITQADAFQQVITALGQVDDKTKQYAAGQALLGTQFEDLGVDAALALSTVGTNLDDVAGKTQGLDSQYTGLGNTFEGLKRKALTSFLQPLAEQMGGVMNAALPLVGALGSLALAIPALLPVIGPVVAILAGPLTLAIVGIGAAVAALVLAWTNDWGGIQGKTQAVIDAIRPILDALGGRLSEFGQTILPELVGAWESMSGAVQGVVNALQPVIEGVFGAIQGFLQAHSTEIQTILQAAWDAISTIINTVTGVISNTIQFWLNVFQGDWSGAWENIKNIVQIIWDGITSLIDIALKALPAIISLGMAAVQAVIEGAWGLIMKTVDGAINGEYGVIAIMRAMPGAIVTALGAIGTLLVGIGRDLIQGFINGVNELWDSAINFVRDLFNGVIGAVKEKLGIASPSTVMAEAGRNFIQGFIDGTGSMAGALKDFVVGIAKDAFEGFKGAVGGALGAVGGAVGDAAGALGGIFGGGGGSAGGVTIARTTPDGRIGYTANDTVLSEGQVRGLIMQAAQIVGVPLSAADVNTLVARAQQESGFHTGAVNLWDVNAQNGTPSIGILQTIGPTFQANAMAGYGDITNPLDNIIAALRYIERVYGGPGGLPGLNSGYARGGTHKAGWFVVGEEGFEVGHLGPNGMTIFPHDLSKQMLPGFADGTSNLVGMASGITDWAQMPSFTPESIQRYLEILQQLNAAYAAGLISLETFNAQVEGLNAVLVQTSTTVPPLVDYVNGLGQGLTAASGEILNTTNALPPLAAYVNSLGQGSVSATGEITSLGDAIVTTTGQVMPLVDYVNSLGQGTVSATGEILSLGNGIQDTGAAARTTIAPLSDTSTGLTNVASAATGAASSLALSAAQISKLSEHLTVKQPRVSDEPLIGPAASFANLNALAAAFGPGVSAQVAAAYAQAQEMIGKFLTEEQVWVQQTLTASHAQLTESQTQTAVLKDIKTAVTPSSTDQFGGVAAERGRALIAARIAAWGPGTRLGGDMNQGFNSVSAAMSVGGMGGGGESGGIDYDRLANAIVRAIRSEPIVASVSASSVDRHMDSTLRGTVR